jgi:hypothetical protein
VSNPPNNPVEPSEHDSAVVASALKSKPKPAAKARIRDKITLDPELTGVQGDKLATSGTEEPDPTRGLEEYKPEHQIAILKVGLEKVQQQLQEDKDLHSIRQRHAEWLFKLTVGWIAALGVIVLLQGFHLYFQLSDTVMIAFMTSTTATVLGLYGIAAYWMYRNGKPPSSLQAGKNQAKSKRKSKKTAPDPAGRSATSADAD